MTTPSIDPNLTARLQALRDRTTTPADPTTNRALGQQAADLDQGTLTLTERLEHVRGRLHQQEQDTTRQWENVRDQMPLDDNAINRDRGMIG